MKWPRIVIALVATVLALIVSSSYVSDFSSVGSTLEKLRLQHFPLGGGGGGKPAVDEDDEEGGAWRRRLTAPVEQESDSAVSHRPQPPLFARTSTLSSKVKASSKEAKKTSPVMTTIASSSTVGRYTAHSRRTRKPGRDLDVAVMGLVADPVSGINHAWSEEATNGNSAVVCHGSRARASCIDPRSEAYFRRHAVLGIITGAESAFRVEVSNCTWLSHFPADRVFVFSDLVPQPRRRYPYTWVRGMLPKGVVERDGDVFSSTITKGYLREVRRAGQGYSVSWIVAQFRFLQALEYFMLRMGLLLPHQGAREKKGGNASTVRGQKNKKGRGPDSETSSNLMFFGDRGQQAESIKGDKEDGPSTAEGQEEGLVNAASRPPRSSGNGEETDPAVAVAELPGARDIRWVVIGDDDTIFQLDGLVKRLKSLEQESTERPLYLSQTGWGGAGHIFSVKALHHLRGTLSECVTKYMVKRFLASDAMMVKCAGLAKLEKIKDPTMSHCPASNARQDGLLRDTVVSVHAKKDFYPPVSLATWRIGLYYHALYCKQRKAADSAVFFSGCAFGSCKHPLCEKSHDAVRKQKWADLVNGSSGAEVGAIVALPFDQYT